MRFCRRTFAIRFNYALHFTVKRKHGRVLWLDCASVWLCFCLSRPLCCSSVPWPFEMSHSFRNAALPVTGHWRTRERCCRQLKTSGLSSSVILHFQLSQNLTFPHLRVNASQTSVGAWQLRGSCLRFLQQISWHFQLTAVASTWVFRSHQEMVRIGISPEDRRYVPGQIKKVVHMNFAVAGGGEIIRWLDDRRLAALEWYRLGAAACPTREGRLSWVWHESQQLYSYARQLCCFMSIFFFNSQNLHFFNGYKII